jgi:hypothetical protein
MSEPTKQCTKCGRVLPLPEFNRRQRGKFGRSAQCKECYNKQRRKRVPETLPEGFKRCSKCKEVKPYSEFHRAASSKDGYRSNCKQCVIEATGRAYTPKEIVPEGLKRCSKCRELYPATDEYFKKASKRKSGLDSRCKSCAAECTRNWYADTIEERREYNRKRYWADPETQRILSRQWYRQNKKRHRAQSIQWREANRERARELERQRYLANRQAYIEKSRQWRKENYERYREYNQRWNESNPEKAAAIRKSVDIRRRARLRELPDDFSIKDWQVALEYWGHKCAVCGRSDDDDLTLAADHWIPLSHPDCPGTVPTNIIVLCNGKNGCNNIKHNRMPDIWLVEQFGEDFAANKLNEIEQYFTHVRKVAD